MRKIYKSALVVAAMAFATVAIAQTAGSLSGISGVKYEGGKVKITTDYPKGNYSVKVDGVEVASYSDITGNQSVKTLEVAVAIEAGKKFSVELVKKAANSKLDLASGAKKSDLITGIAADFKSLGASISVVGNVVTVNGEDVTSVEVIDLNAKSEKVQGSVISVSGAAGIRVVKATIKGFEVQEKVFVQ